MFTADNIPEGTERIGLRYFAYKTINGVPHWTCPNMTEWVEVKPEHRSKYVKKSVPVKEYLAQLKEQA